MELKITGQLTIISMKTQSLTLRLNNKCNCIRLSVALAGYFLSQNLVRPVSENKLSSSATKYGEKHVLWVIFILHELQIVYLVIQ